MRLIFDVRNSTATGGKPMNSISAKNGENQDLTLTRGSEHPWLTWARKHDLAICWAIMIMMLAVLAMMWPTAPEAPAIKSQPSTFVASSGDSLVKEYGYDNAINIAEFVGLPLGKRELGGKLVPITYAKARELRSETDQNLVRAAIYPKDRIQTMRYPNGQVDLINGFVLFTPAPNSPPLAKR